MKIKTSLCYYRGPYVAWSAVDDDTYDGAEDSSNRNMVGYGATRDEAIEDLKRLCQERDEAETCQVTNAQTGEVSIIDHPGKPDFVNRRDRKMEDR